MSVFELYLITRLDSINSFFSGIIVLCFVSIIILIIIYAVKLDNNDFLTPKYKKLFIKKIKKYIYINIWVLIISIIFSLAIPNEKEFLEIYAGRWATNSKEMKNLPNNTIKALNKLLEDYNKKDNK